MHAAHLFGSCFPFLWAMSLERLETSVIDVSSELHSMIFEKTLRINIVSKDWRKGNVFPIFKTDFKKGTQITCLCQYWAKQCFFYLGITIV